MMNLKVAPTVAPRHLTAESIAFENGIVMDNFVVKTLGEEVVLQKGSEKTLCLTGVG